MEVLIRQTNIRKRANERRIATFTVLAFFFAFLWILLAPILSYEPSDLDFYPRPGTELARFNKP